MFSLTKIYITYRENIFFAGNRERVVRENAADYRSILPAVPVIRREVTASRVTKCLLPGGMFTGSCCLCLFSFGENGRGGRDCAAFFQSFFLNI